MNPVLRRRLPTGKKKKEEDYSEIKSNVFSNNADDIYLIIILLHISQFSLFADDTLLYLFMHEYPPVVT